MGVSQGAGEIKQPSRVAVSGAVRDQALKFEENYTKVESARMSARRSARAVDSHGLFAGQVEMEGYVERKMTVHDEMLYKHGYAIMSRVVSREETAILYLRTVTCDGDIVYVIPDVEGYECVNENTVVLARGCDNAIPHAEKTGALKCTSTGGCGAVFECDEGICAVTLDEKSARPVEMTLGDASSPHHGVYAVVRMSEIFAKPHVVRKSVRGASKRLAVEQAERLKQAFSAADDVLACLRKEQKRFQGLHLGTFRSLVESSHRLAKYFGEYADVELIGENGQRFHKLLENISQRKEIQCRLMAMASVLVQKTEEMHQICDAYKEMSHALENIGDLHKVL